jgi:hypothetical protein
LAPSSIVARVATSLLPLFPLQSPALFPGCVAPLHIFEPRYRALVADAIAGERRIGMATVRPEALADMAGDPPLFEIGCAGFIAQHQRLADGRYLVLLQATTRFRILRETPREGARLYRVAEVEALAEVLGDAARIERHRTEVEAELEALLEANPEHHADLDLEQLGGLDPASFINGVAQALGLPPPEKQALLEADTAAERFERLAQTLAFYRSLSGQGAGPTLH